MKHRLFLRRCSIGSAMLVACAALGACATRALPPGSNEDLRALSTQEYRLGAGDKLRVTTFGHEDLSSEFSVSSSGAIAFPLVGNVPAANLTAKQLEQALGQQLGKGGFVVNPVVSVEVIEYRPFYILGEVETPGRYPFAPGLTAASAIATAGGFTYRAKESQIYIRRSGSAEEIELPLTATTPVFPGDTIRIGERMF